MAAAGAGALSGRVAGEGSSERGLAVVLLFLYRAGFSWRVARAGAEQLEKPALCYAYQCLSEQLP